MSQTILVVEDEAANLRLISLFLEEQGYRCPPGKRWLGGDGFNRSIQS